MKKNLGNSDKVIRAVLGIVLGVLYFTSIVTGGLGIAVLVAGIILLATSSMSFCPVYALFGARTCPVEK